MRDNKATTSTTAFISLYIMHFYWFLSGNHHQSWVKIDSDIKTPPVAKRNLSSEWMHWSAEGRSSSHQIQLRCTSAFTGGSSLCHRWQLEENPSDKFCYVLLHVLNWAMKFIPGLKRKHRRQVNSLIQCLTILNADCVSNLWVWSATDHTITDLTFWRVCHLQ